jgi:16S rRNA (adenine(1408)-N(1))-methyltransferase
MERLAGVSTFDQVLGRKLAPLEPAVLAAACTTAQSVLIDVGTGQGKFILDAAKEDPDRLCIGIDAVAENMAASARTSRSSPKKGGLPNALFVRAAAERLPGPFAGCADELTVQYPWGSLMRIVSEPDLAHLTSLRALCKADARLSVLLNYSVFEDRPYLERLGMGDISDPAENPDLITTYAQAGFTVTNRELIHGDPPIRSAWGRHLVRGSARATLMIDAVANPNWQGDD